MLDGKPLWMELETEAEVSLVSEKTFQMVLHSSTAQVTRTQLCTYSRETIPVVGKVEVDVQYQEQRQGCL